VCLDRVHKTTDSELSLLQQLNEIVSANQQRSTSPVSVDYLLIVNNSGGDCMDGDSAGNTTEENSSII